MYCDNKKVTPFIIIKQKWQGLRDGWMEALVPFEYKEIDS